jgi:integrase
LPKNTKARAVEHHASCPHEQVGALLEQVRKSRSSDSVKWAFEFIVLTAARSGEVRGAVWEEIDAKTKTWTIPKERMKAGREHSVPLSQAAWDVLQQARGLWTDGTEPAGLIFPGTKNKPISDMTLTQLLRRMQQPYTVHGFRASFRTWGADIAHYEHDMLEIALSHIVGDATVRAYHRSDMVEKRRRLMGEWAMYLQDKSSVAAPQ